MNPKFENPDQVVVEARLEAEGTLRLLAKAPEPEGLKDRVHRRLRDAVANSEVVAEPRGFWAMWRPVQRLQFAGAAILVAVIAISMWSVYHGGVGRQPGLKTGERVVGSGGAQSGAPAAVPSQGNFGTAGAERVPPTLAPIKVPPAPKKKPSASKTVRHGQKPAAGQVLATPPSQ